MKKKKMITHLSSAVVLALCGTAMVSRGALVGEWKFDEGAGQTAANTAPTGVSYDGAVGGSPTWVTGHDGTGYALDFNGVDGNYVSIDPGLFASVSNEITIAFWAYGNTNQPAQQIAFQATPGRTLQSHLPWENDRVYWDAAGRYDLGVSTNLTQGAWTYWVMTKNADEGTQKIYANGQLLGSATGLDGQVLGIDAFSIGADVGGLLAYEGTMDEFQIYDNELSYEEIAIEYNPDTVVAQIEQDEAIGLAPLEIIFNATNSFAGNGISDYLWDFGSDPSNVVIDATGLFVTNTFTTVGEPTITLYVVDSLGVTNSATTTIKVLDSSAASEVIDLVAIVDDPDYIISSQAYYDSSILFLLTDNFGYHPNDPTAFTPALAHSDGFHGNEADGGDVWLSFTNATPYTTSELTPVIVMDVWGRNYGSAKGRDDDFDVVLYNGSWDEADIVSSSDGNGVEDSSNYTRAIINYLPLGTTFDRVRIVGHNSSGGSNNPFTLTEVRLAALAGEVVTVVARVSADPVSGYYPLDVGFAGTNSFAVEGTITEYLWDFGDGNTDSGVLVSNTYTETGVFTNILSVVNSVGETNSTEVVITANNPINVDIALSNNTASVGIDIVFDGSGSTNMVGDELTSYLWDFGDGNTANGMTGINSYAVGGTNTVTLTIEDATGRSNTGTTVVYIIPASELSLSGNTLSWDTSLVKEYEVQYTDNLTIDSWETYTNVTATPPTTSIELPIGRAGIECFRVLRHE